MKSVDNENQKRIIVSRGNIEAGLEDATNLYTEAGSFLLKEQVATEPATF